MVSEVHESERDPLDALHPVVDGFGRAVGDMPVPRDDLRSPEVDRATETADLERHLQIGQVVSDLGNPLSSEVGVGVVVDLMHDLFRVPREPHLTMRVTGTQPDHQLVVLTRREPLVCGS